VLTIAGSDPSGGAGIQSDLKTFRAHGVYGLCVITSLTSQNTLGVQHSSEVPLSVVHSQLESLFSDFKIDAVKTGMLSSERIIRTITPFLDRFKGWIVVDPVIYSKTKYPLLNGKGIIGLKKSLLPLAYLVTPNLFEAEVIADMKIETKEDIEIVLKKIHRFGSKNVLLKGGHMPAEVPIPKATDILYDGKNFTFFRSRFIRTKHTHGIGCAFSSAIVANIALGKSLREAITLSKRYVINRLNNSQPIGKGISPVEQ